MKNQNLVIMVLLAQTIILVWLAIKLAGLQSDVEKISAFETFVDPSLQIESTRPAPLPSASSGLNAAEVRTIIRSELDAFAADVLSGEQKLVAETREKPPAPKTDPAELARLQAEVNGQLNLMHSGVSPSRVDFARLEQNIARLPPGQREDAIKRMFSAVSQGKVDVRF